MCKNCQHKAVHVTMALFLALWTASITALVLRRALFIAQVIDSGTDEDGSLPSVFLPTRSRNSRNREAESTKEDAMHSVCDANDTPTATHSGEINVSLAGLQCCRSYSCRKLHVAEISKVSETT